MEPITDWSNEWLASLLWVARVFAFSVIGFTLVAWVLIRRTRWGRQFWRLSKAYFIPQGRGWLNWRPILTVALLLLLTVASVRLDVVLAMIVGGCDINGLQPNRALTAIARRLEQFTELDIHPRFGSRSVVDQHRVAGPQIFLMQRLGIRVAAVKRGEADLNALREEVILELFNRRFVARVADEIQFRCIADGSVPCRFRRNGRRLFLRGAQPPDEILLQEIQVAFDDFHAVVQLRIFLHAAEKISLPLIFGITTRHPYQPLQLFPLGVLRRESDLQGLD